MIRHLSILNGLAILAVVGSHSASWGYTAMFWWADRYRPVTAPIFDQAGTPSYYILLAMKCLTTFSVPAFLFISGFFVAYMARGSQTGLTWDVLKVRLKNLLLPYLIWSIVIFVGDAIQGITYTPARYLTRLAFGEAHPVYYFIPLICLYYLLSPLVVSLARANAGKLLFASLLLQLGALGLRYLRLFGVEISYLVPTVGLLFPMVAIYFTSGVVTSFRLPQLKLWLSRAKWGLLAALVALGALAILESDVVYRLTGILAWGGGPNTISTSLYAVVFILCFLAFNEISVPFSKQVYWLGTLAFGIYLLHPKVLELVARSIRQVAPWLLAHQLLYQSTLILLAIGGPVLFMSAVARSPARKAYRHLFG